MFQRCEIEQSNMIKKDKYKTKRISKFLEIFFKITKFI